MPNTTKILSIDDNELNRELIEEALKDDFELVSSDGSGDVVELVKSLKPNIILLDVVLENCTGYELCQAIRDAQIDLTIEIIFVSSLNSLSDKLKAYKCGGDDYICKPMQLKELKEKLRRVEQKQLSRLVLEQNCEQASNTAFSSMKQASELGQLIQFVEESLALNSFDCLYQCLQQYFSGLGISFVCEFRTKHEFTQYPKHNLSKLEGDILEIGRSAERIITFRQNILFNSPWCSLLIKRLPIDNEELIGRVRDNLAILLKVIDSRVMHIENEKARHQERLNALNSIKKGMTERFSCIKEKILAQDGMILAISSDFYANLENKIIPLGLSGDQESELFSVVDETTEAIQASIGLSVSIDNELSQITHLLHDID